MRVKGIIEEDFVNYKKPSMFINTCFCDFKCCVEAGINIDACQNSGLAKQGIIDIPKETIYEHFSRNDITKAVVIGGMEPILQIDEVCSLISYFRDMGDDSVFVIYTGYNPDEIKPHIAALKKYKNVIIKFGRFVPNEKSHFDETLGVNLVSGNQFAVKIS